MADNNKFKRMVADWVKGCEETASLVMRKVALDISARMIMRTAVDTGRARGNWVAGIGQPVKTYDNDKKDKEGGPTLTEILGALSDYRAESGQSIFITNSVPYIVPLEYGHSSQHPEGMVRVTAAEFYNIVNVNVMGLRE